MKEFSIYYDDLNADAKSNYLDFLGVNSEDELNYEIEPLAILNVEEERKCMICDFIIELDAIKEYPNTELCLGCINLTEE